jgi:hypothetical protein
MISNAPLSLIGVYGLGMYLFILLVGHNSDDFWGTLGGALLIGVGLWLEYRYYTISVRELELRKEKIAWSISITYNALILIAAFIGMIGADKDHWYYGLLLLIYPAFVGGISLISLNKLRGLSNDEIDFEQQEE